MTTNLEARNNLRWCVWSTFHANSNPSYKGENFSYSVSFTEGDAIPTSAPTVGAVSPFSNQTSNAAGTAGDLAGSINADGSMSLTAWRPWY